jgi:hypothetical protein
LILSALIFLESDYEGEEDDDEEDKGNLDMSDGEQE